MISKRESLRKSALLAILFLGLGLPGNSLSAFSADDISGTLSIDDCVEIALRNNPGHQKTERALEASSANLLASYGRFLPTVTARYGISEDRYINPTFLNPEGTVSSFPMTIPGGTIVTHEVVGDSVVHVIEETEDTVIPIPEGRRRFSGGQILVSETIFQGGQNVFNLLKARHEKEAARRNIDASELDLVYQIHKQYYQVLADMKRVELADEVLQQREEQLRLARARHEVGSVTRLDVMQAEIDRGNQENTLTTEQNDLKVSRMELNRLMGIPLDIEFDMVDNFDTFEPAFDEQKLIEGAMSRRPDLMSLVSQENAAAKEVWIQRGSYLPSLTFDLYLFRNQQGSGNDPFSYSPDNEDTRLALNLNWEFFSGFSRHSSARAASVNLENLRYDLLDKKLLIEQEVKEAVMNLESVFQQSRITGKNRQLASETLRLEQERYRLGSSSLLDLRTAQVTYVEAETEHINKVFEFNTSYAALEKATGLDLKVPVAR